MPPVSFSFRFIIDRHFFNEVMKNNTKTFLSLMYISSCSFEYKREHNLMSKKIRQDLIDQNPNYSPEYIKSSLNKIDEPEEIENIEDELVRNIQYAVHYTKVSSQKITPICILTSDNMKEKYRESPHMAGMRNVLIKSGDEAVNLLEEFKQLAWTK